MKRTTLVLEEGCMEGIRDLARREGRPLSAVVNELLAEGLLRRRESAPREFNLPAYDMGRPMMNVADRDALAGLTEGGSQSERAGLSCPPARGSGR